MSVSEITRNAEEAVRDRCRQLIMQRGTYAKSIYNQLTMVARIGSENKISTRGGT